MSIVFASRLAKYYGAQDVFADLAFSVARGDRIGLVGPNGSGKTTLLRLILGLEEPSQGSVHRARGLRVGYLPQEARFASQQTLYAEMLSVFAALRRQEQALLALAEEMAVAENPDALMARYASAEQRFELGGGYTYENRIRRVLSGLGFVPDTYESPVGLLSGGQITRALLARLLLQEPDLLLLDEPSNHLDLGALEWLESYLRDWPHSLLVVAHDRFFLDKVVSRIWELDRGRLERYRGNYSRYAAQRRQRAARRVREYQEQQEFIHKTEEFIRRYKAGQRSKEARGRQKRLNRLERIERPRRDPRMRLRLSAKLRSGDNVLMSDGALIGYETRPGGSEPGRLALFDTGQFLIQRGQCVALLGPNASGKTTFLRTISGEVDPLAGHLRLGASVRTGYLPQRQDWLDDSKTILEQILGLCDFQVEQARTLLGGFLFSGDEVSKQVGTLSGGERSRLALAILTLRGANLLLLDEPTTHLDLASQEILQEVLVSFGGTILLVSHDRYLVDAVASHVWVIENGRMRQFEGNYSSYLRQLEHERAESVEDGRQLQFSVRPSKARRRTRRRDRNHLAEKAARRRVQRFEALEREITQMEQRLAVMAGLIDQASSCQDLDRLQSLSADYQRLTATLAERFDEWELAVSVDQQE